MASSDLAAFAAKLQKITNPAVLKRVVEAGGKAGKEAALDAASRDLGGDRSMSGLRRKVPLGAGYDGAGGSSVVINFRPAGLWRLASQGRTSSGEITPRGSGRRRSGKQALAGSGFGPVARSRYGPSRGLNTFDDAVDKARDDVPRAAARQFFTEVGRVM
jgi:hypothetical protein